MFLDIRGGCPFFYWTTPCENDAHQDTHVLTPKQMVPSYVRPDLRTEAMSVSPKKYQYHETAFNAPLLEGDTDDVRQEVRKADRKTISNALGHLW